MRYSLLILGLLLFKLSAAASDGVEIFRAGLQAYQANGADALLSAWYRNSENFERISALRDQLNRTTRGAGPVVDTEVFAPYEIGRRLKRLYGVIYFEKRPLWIRAEYYTVNGSGGFISLEFSWSADDILPLEWVKTRRDAD